MKLSKDSEMKAGKRFYVWWIWNPATSRLSSSGNCILNPRKRNQTQGMPQHQTQTPTPIITSERLVCVCRLPLLMNDTVSSFCLLTLDNSGSNVSAYINMVCDTLRNSLPKAVVYCQVREAKRSLLNFFYAQVGRKEVNYIITLWIILLLERKYPNRENF